MNRVMDTSAPSRREWVITIRRFAEVAWTRQGPTRYASVVLTPMLVALLTPGWWWVACAVGTLIGIVIDVRAQAAFKRLAKDAEGLDEGALERAVRAVKHAQPHVDIAPIEAGFEEIFIYLMSGAMDNFQ